MEKDMCKPVVVKHLFSYEIDVPCKILDKYCEKLGIINLNRELTPHDYHKIVESYTKENLPSLISEFNMEIDNFEVPFTVCVNDGPSNAVGIVIKEDGYRISIKLVVAFRMLMNIELMSGNKKAYYRCYFTHGKLRSHECYRNVDQLFEEITEQFKNIIDVTIRDYGGYVELKPLTRITINNEPMNKENCTTWSRKIHTYR